MVPANNINACPLSAKNCFWLGEGLTLSDVERAEIIFLFLIIVMFQITQNQE